MAAQLRIYCERGVKKTIAGFCEATNWWFVSWETKGTLPIPPLVSLNKALLGGVALGGSP